jgi:uncharacterized protein YbjT (DUF2867 family)
MSTPKVLLVTGATGNQGGATIDALVKSPSKSDFQILGVTRDANSAGAKKLASKSPLIKVIQGSYDDIPALFKTARDVTGQPVWGVFSVQVAMGKGASPEKEEKQGKALVDESIKQGVKHFVQSSVDRGGDEKSWTDPTNVPHFASKHNIEIHLRDEAAKAGGTMEWTILRPTAFMENWGPGIPSKIFFAALRESLGPSKSLQVVSTVDIGYFAAQAFINPHEYSGKAIGLAGDELTFPQIEEAFKRVTGSGSGATYGFIGKGLMWGVRELGVMMEWFRTDGYRADILPLKKKNPELLDFETWLGTSSGWAKK